MPKEKDAPKMKMKANIAVAAWWFVLPEAAKVPAAADIATQVRVHPAMPPSMSLRRPMRSTKAAPQRAKKNWKHAYPRLTFACLIESVMPIVVKTAAI